MSLDGVVPGLPTYTGTVPVVSRLLEGPAKTLGKDTNRGPEVCVGGKGLPTRQRSKQGRGRKGTVETQVGLGNTKGRLGPLGGPTFRRTRFPRVRVESVPRGR